MVMLGMVSISERAEEWRRSRWIVCLFTWSVGVID